jgi:MYXO-CTERM domain-containing protein
MFPMNARTCALASIAAGVVASCASASIVTFNDQSLFNTWSANHAAGVSTTNFANYQGFTPTSYSGTLGGVTWTSHATGGLYAQGGVMSTNNAGETLYFDLGSGVKGLGGNFFATDLNFNFVPSTVLIGLSDGSGFVGSVSASNQFTGFWSTGAAITSVSIQVEGATAAAIYPAASSLSLAVVPAPGALALVGAAGLVARRRRR